MIILNTEHLAEFDGMHFIKVNVHTTIISIWITSIMAHFN